MPSFPSGCPYARLVLCYTNLGTQTPKLSAPSCLLLTHQVCLAVTTRFSTVSKNWACPHGRPSLTEKSVGGWGSAPLHDKVFLEPTCPMMQHNGISSCAMVTPHGMAEMGKMIVVMSCKRSLHWITQEICMISVLTSLTKYPNIYHTWVDVHWKVDSGWHDCCPCFFGFQARAYQCQVANIKTFRKVTVPRLWYDTNPALGPSASQMPSN